MSPTKLVVAVLVAALLMTSSAQAASYTWDAGGEDELWSTDANWSSDIEPTSSDDATINTVSEANAVIISGAAAVANNVYLAGAGYTSYLNIQDDLTVTAAFRTANKGTGTVTQSDGDLTCATFQVISSTTTQGTGTYTLSGTGTITATSTFSAGGGTGSVFTQSGASTSVQAASITSGNTGGSDRYTYQIASGSLTVTGSVSRNYGAWLFEQTGGTVSIGTELSLGNNYRTDSSGGPMEWIISGNSSLSIGTNVTLGWVGDGGTHLGTNSQGRFTLKGSKGTGSNVTVGGNWRQTGSGTPNTSGSLGTINAIIDQSAADTPANMRKVAVTGNVTFDDGSVLDVAFDQGVNPTAATWTLMTWSGTLTDNGLEFAEGVDTQAWSFSTANSMLTVSYVLGSPAAPTNLGATAVSSTQIDLSWTDNANNESGFKIERKTTGEWGQIDTVGANITTYNDTSVEPSTTYYYRVRATNATGDSDYSNEASDTTPPAAPTALSATAVSSSQINLGWTDNSSNETGFKIERKTTGSYAQIDTVGAGVTTYNDTGLDPATTYYYRVRAYNGDGDSPYSNEAYDTTEGPTARVWDANGGNGGDWNTAVNWNPDGVPASAEDATINTAGNDATHPVTISSAAAVAANLYLGGTGYNSYLTIQNNLTVTGTLRTSYKGTGTITHSAGDLTCATFQVISSTTTGGKGTYTLSGTGTITATSTFSAGGGTGSVFTQSGASTSVQAASITSGNTGGSDRYNYEIASGTLTVTGSVSRNYGAWLFEQTGGTASIGTELSLGNNYRTDSTGGPMEWIISGDSSLSIGTNVTMGWVGDGGSHLGTNSQGRFTLDGSKGTGSDVTVGGNWRQTGSGTPNTSGSLGTLKGVIDQSAANTPANMRKVAVTGNVTFDDGSILDIAFAGGVTPTDGTWTLLTWSGTLTDNGLEFAGSVDVVDTDGSGPDGAWSFNTAGNQLTVMYASAPPNAPSGLSATAASSTQINLAWTDNSSNETGFKIERKTTGEWSQIDTVGASITAYNDTGLDASTTYYYRVRATNATGDSSYSNEANDTTPPAAPSGLTATVASSSQINLGWTDNSSNETGFKIERKTGWGGTFAQIDTVGSGVTTYQSTGLSASTHYIYRVRAYNNDGDSDYSNEAGATTASPPPAIVAAGAVASGTGTITPALPASIETNDILLLFVETANEAVTISNQNGGTWTEVTGSPQGTGTAGGTSATRLTAFWSRYNGAQGNPTVSDSGNHQIARIIAVRGIVTSGDPWDVTAGGVESTSDTSGAIPGATTTVPSTLVVAAIATALPDASSTTVFSSWANGDLTSVTERTDNATSSGNGGGLGIATGVKAAAGAYGNTTVTTSSSTVKGMMSIALKAPPPAPETLTGQGFQVHITGPDQDWDEIAASGAKFIRKGLHWSAVETTQGVYNFSTHDAILADMEERGLGVLFCLAFGNSLYPPPQTTQEGREAYAAYAAAAAEHYAGHNVIFEIWNEPNTQTFWGGTNGNSREYAQQYMALVEETVPAMRAADPDCYILGGSISCLWSASLIWTDECLKLGMMTSGINAISVHPYGFSRPELCIDASQPGAVAGEGYWTLRELMDLYGNEDFPVVNSECGYATGTNVTLDQQAMLFVRMYLVDQLCNIGFTAWYCWDEIDAAAFVFRSDGDPLPNYIATGVMNTELDGYHFAEAIKVGPDCDYQIAFENDAGERKVVAWTVPALRGASQDQAVPHDVVISTTGWSGGNDVVVHDIYGDDADFETGSGTVTVEVTASPLYIYLGDPE